MEFLKNIFDFILSLFVKKENTEEDNHSNEVNNSNDNETTDTETINYNESSSDAQNEDNNTMESQNTINVISPTTNQGKKSYFTIKELCASQKADKQGIKNTPTPEVETCLNALIDNVLDPLREKFGKPITVISGYRNKKLNTIVGGASTSQHVKGQAADIVYKQNLSENKKLFDLLSEMKYDQLIYEKGNDQYPAWVHVSWNPNGNNRQQRLRTKDGKTYYKI